MAKKNVPAVDVSTMSPDELDSLKQTTNEFMNRLGNIENEIDTLKEDRKALVAEFREKLDVKTLQSCIRVLKIQRSVAHRDTFDALMEILKDPSEV